ncbi:hypothetical protein ACJMK2_034564 [Sinanodonta woodiana]|uniref:Phenazine biosynthesis-like domain-containing protein n=1 Tax=Sinanodonta woodiana TaxID=1069815 RepID=A0ABD3WU49_SINWO
MLTMVDLICKKKLPMYIVHAFTDEAFRGNPAAVCPVPKSIELSESQMQKLAAEMNLSETAYIQFQPQDKQSTFENSDRFSLRWFTPTNEVPLCGHATLASAAILFNIYENQSPNITFDSKSGPLIVSQKDEVISLDFPLNPTQKQDRNEFKELLQEICDDSIIFDVEYSSTTKKLLVRLNDDTSRSVLEEMKIDTNLLMAHECTGKIKGVIVTLKGSEENGSFDKHGNVYDFVSRYFAPWVGIPEDPVTGSAHTVLADYWGRYLKKSLLNARQCSARGGDIKLKIQGDRVKLMGRANIFLTGHVYI